MARTPRTRGREVKVYATKCDEGIYVTRRDGGTTLFAVGKRYDFLGDAAVFKLYFTVNPELE